MSSGASPRSLLEALGDKAALVPRAPKFVPGSPHPAAL
jgi:hypothetical protein